MWFAASKFGFGCVKLAAVFVISVLTLIEWCLSIYECGLCAEHTMCLCINTTYSPQKNFFYSHENHIPNIFRAQKTLFETIKSEPELILDSTPKMSFSIWNRQKSGNRNFFTLILWFPIHIQTIIWSFYCRRSNGVYARWHEFFKW